MKSDIEAVRRLYAKLFRRELKETKQPLLPFYLDYLLRGRTLPAMRTLNGKLGKVRLGEALRSTWMAATLSRDPEIYRRYNLTANWRRRRDFVYHDEIVTVLTHLNKQVAPDDSRDLSDKRLFARRCEASNLPTAPILAEFSKGFSTEIVPHEDWKFDLFSKFPDRWCGIGAGLWRYANERFHGADGVFTATELRDHLASLDQPVILQSRIMNHPDLRSISGQALSTVRVVTVRAVNKSPEVAVAAFRMGTGKEVADNFAVGGIAAPVDLKSGRLGPAASKRSPEVVRSHPDTGAPIEGVQLPQWEEVKQLALRAHREFSSLPSVGWDVVITEDEPLLIEGNPVWCVELIQMSHRRPLSETIVPQVLASHIKRLRAGLG